MYVGLHMAGKLNGRLNTGSLNLYDAVNKREVFFSDHDEMFNFFYSKFENVKQFLDLLFVFGIDDNTMCLFDTRTVDFFDAYSFYKSNPKEAYSEVYYIWYKVYSLINKIMTNNIRQLAQL